MTALPRMNRPEEKPESKGFYPCSEWVLGFTQEGSRWGLSVYRDAAGVWRDSSFQQVKLIGWLPIPEALPPLPAPLPDIPEDEAGKIRAEWTKESLERAFGIPGHQRHYPEDDEVERNLRAQRDELRDTAASDRRLIEELVAALDFGVTWLAGKDYRALLARARKRLEETT